MAEDSPAEVSGGGLGGNFAASAAALRPRPVLDFRVVYPGLPPLRVWIMQSDPALRGNRASKHE